MTHIALHAVTKLERNFVTSMVMDEISAQGGWVEDVHLFSNIMTTIRFVIKQAKLADLRAALNQAGLQVSRMDEAVQWIADADCNGSLQVTFVHNEPDLRREIPQVPG